MKIILSLVTALVGCYIIIIVLLYIFQERLVYFPTSEMVATPASRGLEYEDVTFETSDEYQLHGWYVPASNATFTLLFFHGNAGNISHRLESIEQFNSMGLNVFIFDYRGYGKSTGSPSEEGTYQDGIAAWEYLKEVKGSTAETTIVFGRSLGGPIASWLALNRQPAGLIIESTFTSLPELGAEIYPLIPVRLLSRIQYPTKEYVSQIEVPILIGHSMKDSMIPFHHGRNLYNAAREPRYWLEMMGDHNVGYLETGEAYITEISRFISYIENNHTNR